MVLEAMAKRGGYLDRSMSCTLIQRSMSAPILPHGRAGKRHGSTGRGFIMFDAFFKGGHRSMQGYAWGKQGTVSSSSTNWSVKVLFACMVQLLSSQDTLANILSKDNWGRDAA